MEPEIITTRAAALKAHKEGDNNIKTMLETLFPAVFEKQKDVMQRIKTFDDVLKEVDLSKEVMIILTYSGTDDDLNAAKTFLKIKLIAQVLNEGWIAYWNDSNQYKYYPWMEHKAGKKGLSYYHFDRWHSNTCVGSRLCFKSSELAKYAATTFQKEYNEYMNPLNQ